MLRPFVYRRYLDFSAIEALRTMKQLIQQEVRRKGMASNIKLGAGGIREVEFIAQAFQLIHGGAISACSSVRCSVCWPPWRAGLSAGRGSGRTARRL